MPGISTSSDIYQNRNQGLTTYRKNVQGPTLSDEMAKRTEERAEAAQVQARQEPGSVAPAARPTAAATNAVSSAAAAGVNGPTATSTATTGPASAAAKPANPDPVTPAKVVHELYAPTSRTTREHDDRHSMITGGTVDRSA